MPYRFNAFTNRLDLTDVGGGGGGTVTSFTFTDGNGFDGTVTNPTTTPTLSLETTVANFNVIYADAGALTGTGTGTTGQVLTSNGSSAAPTWEDAPTGGITTIDGDSGSITGSTVTVYANNSSNTCGKTIKFVNSGSTSTLNVTDVNDNTTLGQNAGHSGQSGFGNVGYGSFSLGSLQSGSQNTAVGRAANYFLTIGSSNTSLGFQACESLIDGSDNISIGVGAASTYSGSESGNINIGNNGVVGESNVTRIGANQTECFVAGINGNTVSNTMFVTIDSMTNQLGTSSGGGGGITQIDGNTGSTTGPTVTFTTGFDAGFSFDVAGTTVTMNNPRMFIDDNIFFGSNTGNLTLTGIGNIGIGDASSTSLTTGSENIGIGAFTLNSLDQSSHNICIGYFNSVSLTGASSGDNTIIGFQAMINATSCNSNTVLGSTALSGILTGSSNLCLGYGAGSSYTGSESYNILLFDTGTVGENQTIRIGSQGIQTSCYIAGIAGVTVSNTEFVTIDSTTGQLGSDTSGFGYSTGTWSPTVFGASTAGTTTYNYQNGYYTKIGNMVFCGGSVSVASSTGTGFLCIGLPFTVKNQTNGIFPGSVDISAYTWPNNTTNLTLSPTINDTRALINCSGNAAASNYMILALGSTPTINFSVFYQV